MGPSPPIYSITSRIAVCALDGYTAKTPRPRLILNHAPLTVLLDERVHWT